MNHPQNAKHQHGEAYMIMRYRCPKGHDHPVWNSRDGVTPFGIDCPEEGCDQIADHHNWEGDRYEPLHQLIPGEYFFRDGTPEEAKAIILRRLESARGSSWERPESEWPALTDDILEGHEFQAGWPHLDQVAYHAVMPEPPKAGGTILWADGGYGFKSREPFVNIHWKDVSEQMDPQTARMFALSIMEAAEAAEQDGFMIEWLVQTVGMDEAGMATLLTEFRGWRERRLKGERKHDDGV